MQLKQCKLPHYSRFTTSLSIPCFSTFPYPSFRKLHSHPARRANYTAPPSSNALDTERLSLCNIPDTIPEVPAFLALHFYIQHTACNTGRCSSDKTEHGCCSFLPEISACTRRTPTRTAGSRTCSSDTSGKIPHSGCSPENILSPLLVSHPRILFLLFNRVPIHGTRTSFLPSIPSALSKAPADPSRLPRSPVMSPGFCTILPAHPTGFPPVSA